MLKAIFATIIIGIASGAGAVQLTIAEKLEDIMNSKESIRQAIEAHGVQVPSDTPLSQYSAKIGQILGPSYSTDFCAANPSAPVSGSATTHSALSSICSAPSNSSYFPYKNCSGCSPSSKGTGTYDWTGTSCTLTTGSATIYGNGRCSTQSDPNHGGLSSNSSNYCYRATNAPSNNPGVGTNCWCQLCTDSSKTTCGGWVFQYVYDSASHCANDCAYECGYYVYNTSDAFRRAFRVALCAAPQ